MRRSVALSLALALASCAPTQQGEVAAARDAIIGGEPSDDAAVVAIGLRGAACGAPLEIVCSGTVLAPRAVLTAAHCFERGQPGLGYAVLVGASVDAPDATIHRVVRTLSHPRFDPETNVADLAVMIVDPPIAVAPLALSRTPLDDSIIGRDAITIGYGAVESDAAPSGARRRGTVRIAALQGDDAVRIEPGPAMSCRGDSGGPILLDGVIIAATATGDPACVEHGIGVRVDVHASELLDGALIEAERWTAPVPTILRDRICEDGCAGDDDCPDGTLCVPMEDSQRCAAPGAEAGELGEPCAEDGECAEGSCVGLLDGCRCSVPCFAPPIDPAPEPSCGVARGRQSRPSLALLALIAGVFTSWTLFRRVLKR